MIENINEVEEVGVEEEIDVDLSGDEIKEHPFCTKDIKINPVPVTLDNIVKRLQYKEIDLSPAFQRKGDLWTRKKMSRLIESILLRLPLPMFYFDVSDPDKWIVIDGLQRLSTIRRFMVKKDLKLGYLEFLTDLTGKKFSDLDRSYQRIIEETQIMTYQVEGQTPKEVKYSLFNRINTGGLTLTPQEIRQALNQKNHGVRILESMIETDSFKRIVNIRSKRMVANELALRFIGFKEVDPKVSFSQSLSEFLDRTMEKIDLLDESYIEKYKEELNETLIYIEKIMSKDVVFNKTLARPRNMKSLNRSLFDVWTITIYKLDGNERRNLLTKKVLLREKYKELLLNQEFDDTITKGSNDKKNIVKKFKMFDEMIREVLI